MNITDHCQLCNHQEIDFKTGSICGITNRKPEFVNKCVNAKFDEKLDEKIKSTNVRYQSILRTKWLVYLNFVVFLLVTLSVILIGYYFAKYLLQFNVISTLPFIIALIGVIGVLPIAIGPLNTFKNELKLAKQRKDTVDAVLDLYGIKYDINIEFGKKYHGTQDVAVDLTINK